MTELALPSVLDAAAASDLTPAVRDAAAAGDLRIDAQAVDRIATPGIQLLLAAARAVRADGRVFEIANPTPALATALRLAGVSHLIEEAA
jgi:anti-anti-sigma regulatory factor